MVYGNVPEDEEGNWLAVAATVLLRPRRNAVGWSAVAEGAVLTHTAERGSDDSATHHHQKPMIIITPQASLGVGFHTAGVGGEVYPVGPHDGVSRRRLRK